MVGTGSAGQLYPLSKEAAINPYHSKTALVVEDESIVLDVMTDALCDAGLLVTGFSDPRQALEAAKSRHFDLIITDIKMPWIDGIAFVSQVREIDTIVPILVVTGATSAESATRTLRAGATSLLLKPFGQDDLMAEIDHVFELASGIRRAGGPEAGGADESGATAVADPDRHRPRRLDNRVVGRTHTAELLNPSHPWSRSDPR
jgi:DNA-binding NtrC family response regulator